MSQEVLSALIGAAGGVLGVLMSFPLLTWRVSQLEKKVDKHNTIIERTYKLENDVEYLKDAVSKIEKDVGEIKYERKTYQTN